MAVVRRTGSADIAPRTPRDIKFCDAWLKHFDHVRAYKEAGFNTSGGSKLYARAKAKLEAFAGYLRPLQEAKSRKVSEQLAIDENDVMRGVAAIAFYNAGDYIEKGDKPIVDDEGNPVTFNGEPVYPTLLKPLHRLTREQLLAVEVVNTGGWAGYRLPGAKVRYQYLDSIGKQLGMFAEKLILERHAHKHKHVKLDLKGVPTEQLEHMTRMLLPLLGEDFARELGVEDLLTVPAKGHA